MIKSNFNRLVGTLNAEEVAKGMHCKEMKLLKYEGVYFNNIFFTTGKPDEDCIEDDVIYREDTMNLLFRPKEQLARIKKPIDKNALKVPSSHFLQVLPPPMEPPEWIFPIHRRLLDMAKFMGMKRVTTHIGAMFGAGDKKYAGSAAVKYQNGKLSYDKLWDSARKAYGNSIYEDSLFVYFNLCREAAKRGISVTIETGCMEFKEISFDIDNLVKFIRKVKADNLGICLDSGHCHFNNLDLNYIIKKAGSLLIETHFHDNFGHADEHNPVGIGTINWRDVIKAMAAASYSGEITFEQGNYQANAMNWNLFVSVVKRGELKH